MIHQLMKGNTTMKYQMDPAHTTIEFSGKHLMVSTVKGHFNEYNLDIDLDTADLTRSQVGATLQVKSLTTGNEQRDGHLLSDDFFSAEKYPVITFKSTSIQKKNDEEYILTGDLTIRDMTRKISLAVEYGGTALAFGTERLGFTLHGSLNRKDFNLNWNALLETGGAIVSDKISINIELEIFRPLAVETAAAN